jgi:hypothetical protein
LIIYGFRTRERTVGGGDFSCPCCKFHRPYSDIEARRWFTLYFIPLFPVYFHGRYLQCHSCGSTFGHEVLQVASPFQGLSAPPIASYAAPSQTPLAPPIAQPIVHGIMAVGQVKPPEHSPSLIHANTYQPYQAPLPSSGLGIASLILGILSPFFLLACGASIFTSLGAVICGHLAILKKPDAHGRAPARGTAVAGLVLGYIFLILSPFALFFSYTIYTATKDANAKLANMPAPLRANQASRDLLAKMESSVTGDSNGIAHGNSEEAIQLAREFSEQIQKLRELAITPSKGKGIQLSGGKFVTHCQLIGDSATFVVHVPEFRKYDDEAKELIADLAWLAAQKVAADRIGPTGRLAVGLKGVLRYGGVYTGTCVGDPEHREVAESADEEYLVTFLESVRAKDAENIIATAPPASPATAEKPPTTAPAVPPVSAPVVANPATPPGSGFTPAPTTTSNGPPSGIDGMADIDGARGSVLPREIGSIGKSTPKITEVDSEKSLAAIPQIKRQKAINFKGQIGGARSIALSPDGDYLAIAHYQSIAVYDRKKGTKRVEIKNPPEMILINTMLFSSDNDQLFVADTNGQLQVFEFKQRKSLLPKLALTGQPGGITQLAARKSASFIVAGGMSGGLSWQQIRNNKPGELRQIPSAGLSWIKAIYLPEEGLDFFAADPHNLLQIDMKTAEVKSQTRLPPTFALEFGFSADGKILAGQSVNGLHLFDVESGAYTYEHHYKGLNGPVCFVPGTSRILAAMDHGVAVFDAELGFLTKFDVKCVTGLIKGIQCSRDGSVIAIQTLDGEQVEIFSIEGEIKSSATSSSDSPAAE